MANGNSVMVLEQGAGWTRGLRTLMRGGFHEWFGTRTWWQQLLIWAAVANAIPLFGALSPERMDPDTVLMLFNIFLGMGGPIGVCVMMQEAIVGEKQSGTAAWILSKPVSRLSFLAGKLVTTVVGVIATMLLAQGLVVWLVLTLVLRVPTQPLDVLAGLGAHLVNLLFYFGLTLMLGALFSHRGPVIGIPLAFLFGQQFVGTLYRPLLDYVPWTLAIPLNGSTSGSVAMALMAGRSPANLLPVWTALVSAALFLAVAAWVFQRQEL